MGQRQAPVFALPEQAVRALGHAARRREPLGRGPHLTGVTDDQPRELMQGTIAAGG